MSNAEHVPGETPPTLGAESAVDPERRVPTSELALGVLHVLVLAAIAVAQPLFSLFGENAEFFVVRGSHQVDIWAFVGVVLFLVPLAALVIELPALLVGEHVYRWVHGAIVAILAGSFAIQVGKRILPVDGRAIVVVGVAAGIGFAVAYTRSSGIRSFVTWMSPAPVLLLATFVFFSPIQRLVLPASTAGYGDSAASAADTPVVLVVLDEFASFGLAGVDGGIDADNYPNFARLAANATWYRKASGVSDASSLAIPAILDGRFPDPDSLPIAADHPRNLFALLGDTHDIYAREPVTALCVPPTCQDVTAGEASPPFGSRMRSLFSDVGVVYLHVLLPEDLTGGLPPVDRVWGDFRANAADVEGGDGQLRESFSDLRANRYIRGELLTTDRVGSVRQFIDELPEGDRAPFVFLYAALPHAPYRYAPSGRQYRDGGELFGLDTGLWTEEEWIVAQGEQRFLMQIAMVDRLLGELLDRLEASGLYDDALIIVTSDHGVGFTPGDYLRSVTSENFGETMSVPLLVKLPGQSSGSVSDSDVRTIDILPTIIDALSIDVDWQLDGRSMLVEGSDRGPKRMMLTDGSVVESDPSFSRWDEAFARKLRLFADGDRIDVYLPSRGFPSGRPVADLPVKEDRIAGTVAVNALAELRTADPDSLLSPTHVTGSVRFTQPFSGNLAVAVNGVVAAVGPLVEGNDTGGRFSYFVPEDVFASGANTISFYAVSGAGDSLELVPLELDEARAYRVSSDGAVTYLVADGVRVPVTDEFDGRVDVVVPRGSVYSFGGWAGDVSLGRPADEIVIVVDGESVLVSAPNLPRSDVAEAYDEPALEAAGFGLDVPSIEIDGGTQIQVFAIIGGERATELPLPAGAFPR